MTFDEVMLSLEQLSTEQTKRNYKSQGVHEPFFGVPTTAMRKLAKKLKGSHELALELYASGNYDAMYFAGMIADTDKMTEADFDNWMQSAYSHMLSDYIVSVTLAETNIAQEVADKWIKSDKELYKSAGWACYEWLLGSRRDEEFNIEKIKDMLRLVTASIHEQPNRTRYSMNGFLTAVGVSFLPLHDEAVIAAEKVGNVEIMSDKGKCSVVSAFDAIQTAKEKGRLGFKRKNVRC